MRKLQKIVVLSLILLVFPVSGQASSNLDEIKSELYTASIALTGLSSNQITRQSQLSLISSELNRLSLNISAILQGRVLGASTSNMSSNNSYSSSRRPLAEVEVSPGRYNSNRVIFDGSHRDVLSFRVEPTYSDIWVRYVEVTFDKEVWRYLDEISLVSGNKVLYKLEDLDDDDFSEIGDDEGYAIRFSGFNYFVKEGLNKTFKVRVKANNSRGYDGIDVKVYLRKGAIRFIDEADVSQSVPYSSAGERGNLSNEFEVVRK